MPSKIIPTKALPVLAVKPVQGEPFKPKGVDTDAPLTPGERAAAEERIITIDQEIDAIDKKLAAASSINTQILLERSQLISEGAKLRRALHHGAPLPAYVRSKIRSIRRPG